jgi:release factor glutamine methyltransferase
MTYKDILARLSKISPEEYELETRIIIESFSEKKIVYIKNHPDEDIYSDALENAIRKREERIPIQYIIGKWDFYRQTYIVNENCLIPRSDTEILVEKAIEILPKNSFFADLCTGSGCIAISTLAERKDTTAIMVDKYPQTLELASKNAVLNGVEQRVQAMLLDVLDEENRLEGRAFDAILSNPPYIRPEVIETLSEEVKKEPYAALYGGEDGLIFYNKIIKDYSVFLKENGFFLFEIGYDQGASLKSIAEKYGYTCEIIKDYSGNDRVAYIKK